MKRSVFLTLLIVSISVFSHGQNDYSSNRDFGWQYVGQPGFSSNEIDWPSLKIDTLGNLYLAFQDRGNDWKASVMKFNGTSWAYVGQPGFSVGEAWTLSLSINQQGELYLGFQDSGNMGKASVMKFDGNTWVYVGPAGISSANASYTSLAISKNDSLFLGFRDEAHGNKASVMKFDGTSWNYVGSPGFSADQAWTVSVAVDSNNRPIIVYEDWGFCSKGTVMKFNGYQWIPLGQEGFTNGVARFTDIALSSNDQPYIAFSDGYLDCRATVLNFNGASWDSVGNQGFSNGNASYPDIEFNELDELYIVYCDGAGGYDDGPTVMKFTDNSWSCIGTPRFALSYPNTPKLVIDQSGNPIVAFSDLSKGLKASVMKYDSIFSGVNNPPFSPIPKFTIFPNPVNTDLYIEFDLFPSEAIEVEIYTLDGHLVHKTSISDNSSKISLGTLPNGIYIIIAASEGKIWSEKIVKGGELLHTF